MVNNFNYIAFSNPDDLNDSTGKVSMYRGRMFEYTRVETAKNLEDLDETSINFLKELPTFLCSEIKGSDSGSDCGVSMIVRYGRISDIKAVRREVTAIFESLIDFGEVDFKTISQAEKVFETTGRFQLQRTHWAVREGDPRPILNDLAERIPGGKEQVAGLSNITFEDVKPPDVGKKFVGTARSIEDFLNLLQGQLPDKGVETFYRGHENEKYELTPSLLRKNPDGGEWLFLPHEDKLCKELMIAHYDNFQGDQYCFDRLVRMQHYGLPTRLLDITSNPLVALFFACSRSQDPECHDGEVIIFRVSKDAVKYYDSDTVSCIANLSNLTYQQKNEIDLTEAEKEFNQTEAVGKLLHYIKSEKWSFEGGIAPDDLGSIVCVKAKQTNARIKSQAGAFLLFGHEATLPETGREDIGIKRIKITDKEHIRRQLDAVNINATTVYPSIDQTAVHLKNNCCLTY